MDDDLWPMVCDRWYVADGMWPMVCDRGLCR